MKHHSLCALIAAILTISGCSHKPSAVASASGPAASQGAQGSSHEYQPGPDPTSFTLLNDNKITTIYSQAFNKAPNYDRLADAYSLDYHQTADKFQKSDILKKLKPQIDSDLSAARKSPGIRISSTSGTLHHYDFAKKAFAVDLSDTDGVHFFNDSSERTDGRFALIDYGSDCLQFPDADSASARSVEAQISSGQPLPYHFEILAAALPDEVAKAQAGAWIQSDDQQGADRYNLPAPGQLDITLYARIVAIEMLDSNNKVILKHVCKYNPNAYNWGNL